MCKFKVGDRVRIVKNMWRNPYKEPYMDKVFTIKEVVTLGDETVYTLDDNSFFNWFEEELEFHERVFNVSELLQQSNVNNIYKCISGVGEDLDVVVRDEDGVLVIYIVKQGITTELLSNSFLICDILDMRFIKTQPTRSKVDGKTALIHMLNGGKAYIDENSTIAYFIKGSAVKTIDLKGCIMSSLLDLSMIMKDDWYIEEANNEN